MGNNCYGQKQHKDEGKKKVKKQEKGVRQSNNRNVPQQTYSRSNNEQQLNRLQELVNEFGHKFIQFIDKLKKQSSNNKLKIDDYIEKHNEVTDYYQLSHISQLRVQFQCVRQYLLYSNKQLKTNCNFEGIFQKLRNIYIKFTETKRSQTILRLCVNEYIDLMNSGGSVTRLQNEDIYKQHCQQIYDGLQNICIKLKRTKKQRDVSHLQVQQYRRMGTGTEKSEIDYRHEISQTKVSLQTLQKQLNETKQHLQRQIRQKNQYKNQINYLSEQINKLKSFLQIKDRSYKQINERNSVQLEEYKRKLTQTQSINDRLNEYQQQNILLNERINQLQQQIKLNQQTKLRKKQKYNRQRQQLTLRIRQLQRENDLLKQQNEKIIKNNKAKKFTQTQLKLEIFFNGNILQTRKQLKQILRNQIQKHMQIQIDKTKLLYNYQRDCKNNFHQYIDKHSNIVLIVETQKTIIAAYYSGIYEQDTALTQQGLIISLDHTNPKTYKLNNMRNYPNRDPNDRRTIRGMIYDKYYLIFGNAQLRIRHGQKNIFSNFGINNSFYNSQRDKVTDLLKIPSGNQIPFTNYEIHQLYFKEYIEEQLQRYG